MLQRSEGNCNVSLHVTTRFVRKLQCRQCLRKAHCIVSTKSLDKQELSEHSQGHGSNPFTNQIQKQNLPFLSITLKLSQLWILEKNEKRYSQRHRAWNDFLRFLNSSESFPCPPTSFTWPKAQKVMLWKTQESVTVAARERGRQHGGSCHGSVD